MSVSMSVFDKRYVVEISTNTKSRTFYKGFQNLNSAKKCRQTYITRGYQARILER